MEATANAHSSVYETSSVEQRLAWLEAMSRQMDTDLPSPWERQEWEECRRRACRQLYSERLALRSKARQRSQLTLESHGLFSRIGENGVTGPLPLAKNILNRQLQGVLKELGMHSNTTKTPI
ncbi:MAG: hypothetical protein HN348_32255 [Proteobacteria bacterium]|nr:hypothetical protein [Pseudomonadota bacterium]